MDLTVSFVESKKMNLKGYTLIEGFPGLGLVGTIATKYLVEKGDFELIGQVESPGFLSIIRVHNGLPLHPTRIYASTKHKLVAIVSEQIIPRQLTMRVAKETVNWIKSKGIIRAISLAGINTGDPKDTTIYGIADSATAQKLLEQNKIQLIKEGITTGVTALILLELQKDDSIEAVSIMGPVSIGADYKASAQLLEKLNNILKLDIDVKPLLKEAKRTEEEILQHLDKLKQTSDTVQKLENKTTTMYA